MDNILAVGESVGGEEEADWPHPHPGRLLEGAGGGVKILHQQNSPRHSGIHASSATSASRSLAGTSRKLRNTNCLITFFISFAQGKK